MICYRTDKGSYEELICGSVRNNTIQYTETKMFESKRLLGYKYSHK